MKKLILIVSFLFASLAIDAQVVNLVQDKDYAVGNDWTRIFDNFKKLTVFDDGTAMISHTNENRYSLFDADGKFLKDIRIYYENDTKKPRNIQPVMGMIGKLYFTSANNMGDIYFFDQSGLIVNDIRIDYQALDMIALDDSHIGVYGSTSWKSKQRYFVSVLDVNTGKYKIVYDYFKADFGASAGDDYYVYANAFVKDKPDIAKVNDNLIVSFSDAGKIRIYSPSGNFIEEKQLDWQPKALSVDEQKVIQNKVIGRYKGKLEAYQKKTMFKSEDGTVYAEYDNKALSDRAQTLVTMLEKGMDHITEPITIGLFTSSIKGTADNVLYFEDAEEQGRNKFRTYSITQGKTISENTFQCDDFDIVITKNRFVVSNGFVYGVQKVKGDDGELRLVRFEMK